MSNMINDYMNGQKMPGPTMINVGSNTSTITDINGLSGDLKSNDKSQMKHMLIIVK